MKYNPDLIVIARESRAYTQGEFASLLGLSQGAVSKIEKGLTSPSDPILQKIAEVLNYPVSFFEQPPLARVRGHYRKKITLPKKDIDYCLAKMTVIERHFNLLYDAVELPETNIPSWDMQTNGGSPSTAAIYAREFWRSPKGRIDNLVRLLEENGIIVIAMDLGESLDGFSTYSETRYPVIFVNSRRPSDRQRFTIAHELCHLTMHWGKPVSEDRDIEKEADEFASEFLMPSNDIKPYLVKLNVEKLSELKRFWKTSMYSIAAKAKSLGLMTQDQYYYLMKNFSYNQYKKFGEPELFPAEKPRLFKDILQVYISDFNYSKDDLSSLLHCNKDEIDEMYFDCKKIKPARFGVIRNTGS